MGGSVQAGDEPAQPGASEPLAAGAASYRSRSPGLVTPDPDSAASSLCAERRPGAGRWCSGLREPSECSRPAHSESAQHSVGEAVSLGRRRGEEGEVPPSPRCRPVLRAAYARPGPVKRGRRRPAARAALPTRGGDDEAAGRRRGGEAAPGEAAAGDGAGRRAGDAARRPLSFPAAADRDSAGHLLTPQPA